jgi:hypothetical protein
MAASMKQITQFSLFLATILLLGLSACTGSIATPTVKPALSPTVQPEIIPTFTGTLATVISSPLAMELTPTEWLPYNPHYSAQGCGEFTAALSVKGTENLSQLEISQKLFETYLGHYRSPTLGGLCRLEDFKLEDVRQDKRLDFLAKEQHVDYINTVQYSVQMKEAPTDWAAGNGELAAEGWINHKFLIIGVTKVNDEYVLKLIGTGP